VLEVVGQLLLINLRSGDLLCRYAGDRFALLLPGTIESHARETAEHLANVLKISRVHTRQGVRLQLSARVACAVAHTDPDVLIDRLNALIEAAPPTGAMPGTAQTVSG
jgi:diguanylate cyclase (GGDEF)-like protein